jgi:anti-sigma factor RsiW
MRAGSHATRRAAIHEFIAIHWSRRMRLDDTLLMAYVDGELPEQERAAVDAAVARSAELAERLAAMQESVLPYRAAFERQVLPPVPPGLRERIEQISASAVGPGPTRRRPYWLALAASFAAGAMLCAMLPLLPTQAPMMSHRASVSPWIQAVADYQVLYSRETLTNVREDHSLSEKIVSNLRDSDGMSVSVPDLHGAGLTFKRVLRLSFHQQPVVQMVYMPDRGEPIALCVTREPGPDVAPQAQRIGEMNVVVWRRGHLGYALLGKETQSELIALGRRVADGDTTSLYGGVG